MDFIAKELAQRNPKIRDVAVNSAMDLRFVKALEQTGYLKSLK
jgi:hypothetical protein